MWSQPKVSPTSDAPLGSDGQACGLRSFGKGQDWKETFQVDLF